MPLHVTDTVERKVNDEFEFITVPHTLVDVIIFLNSTFEHVCETTSTYIIKSYLCSHSSRPFFAIFCCMQGFYQHFSFGYVTQLKRGPICLDIQQQKSLLS